MTAEEYQKLIAKIRQTEKKYSIPSNTLVGLLAHESANFDDDVLSGKKKSDAGAVGIGQFMNETAKEYKIDPTNIDQSIDAAGRYLQGSFKQLGNTDDAILSYNAGVGGVKAYKAGKPMTKKEHKEYVGKVKAQIVKFGGAFPTPKVGVVVAETEIPQKIYEQQTQYLPISERQDVAKLETGEATDLVADTKRLQKEYSEKEKLFLNDYSNLLASEEQASEIPQKVEKKQQTPTTNYLDIYNQVSDFIDNPLAQQGKRFQLQNERNLIQRDNIPTFKKQDKIKILTEAEKEVRRISEIKARQGEIRQHTPQSTFSRVKEIGLNPLTAAGYAARNEDLPENFSKGSRNTLDYAIDVINPVQYVEDAKNLVQGTARGDLGQVGEGLLGVVPMGLEAKNIYKGVKNIPMGINNLGNKYLPNAYKYNPLAFKANSEAYYRKIGDEGLDDLLDSGVLRSKPNGNFVQEQPYFSKGIPMDGGRAGKFKIPALKMTKYKGKYMAEAKDIPFIDVTGITGQPINTILKDTEGLNIYKEDWLQGYKQVEVPKEELIDLYRIQQGGEVYTQQNYTQDEIDFLNHLGNIPSSKNGLYDFPKQIVKVPTKDGRITMKNIDYSVLGIDEFGNKKVMQPQKEYKFEGKNILEIPLAQEGGQYTNNELAFLKELKLQPI